MTALYILYNVHCTHRERASDRIVYSDDEVIANWCS